MKILAIETSCDDTCAAVLDNDRVLSSVISSQTNLHAKWGGVVPNLAKRAHEDRIKGVVTTAFIRSKIPNSKFQILRQGRTSLRFANKSQIANFNNQTRVEEIIEKGMEMTDVIAVTAGPGLAPALGVGIKTAKELAIKYKKRLVAVNHIEGHILSNWINNKNDKPGREIGFPALVLTVSGGHTKIILINQNDKFSIPSFPSKDGLRFASQFSKNKKINFIYQTVGETLDDAAGEALDKAAKLLGLGYPGGPVVERLALSGDKSYLPLPHPMPDKKVLDYSFSGLKTSFYYKIKDWDKKRISQNLANLAASFQRAVIEHLLRKFKLAIEIYQPKTLLASGGVMANRELKKQLRRLAREVKLPIFVPFKKEYNTDNAAMIGVAGYYKALRGEYVEKIEELERMPRWEI